MKKKILLSLLIGLVSVSANAADLEAGKSKAAMCAACHGAKGVSNIPIYPNLAGQKSIYTVKQLKAFKSGARKDPVMASMAKMLSDEDVKNIAAYYESLK